MALTETDLLKWLGSSDKMIEKTDFSKIKPIYQDFFTWISKQEWWQDRIKKEMQELQDTWTFSSTLMKDFRQWLKPKTQPTPITPQTPTVQAPTTTTPVTPVTPTTPTTWLKVDWKDWELWQEELNLYNSLTPEQQKGFWLTRDTLAKNQTDYTKDLAKYLTQSKSNTDYLKSQQEKKTQIDMLTWEVQEIQSSQRIRNAEQQVKNLKQNISYLWSMWMPWISATKLDAVQWQIAEADQKFAELKSIEATVKNIRDLWLDIDTAQYEKQMEDLQTDLDSKVNQQIQSAFNDLLAADANWKLDTIEEIEAFKTQVLSKMDTEIAWITDKNFQERKFLIDQATTNVENAKKQIVENQKKLEEYKENKLKFITKPDWVVVDWNNEPVISAITWQPIVIPQATEKPLFSWIQDWKFVSVYRDENWNLVADMIPVIEKNHLHKIVLIEYYKQYKTE